MNKQDIIDKLKINRSVCASHDFMGNSNHKQIDTMIMVIESDRDEDWIYDNIEDELQDSALAILEVKNGTEDIENILFPATDRGC